MATPPVVAATDPNNNISKMTRLEELAAKSLASRSSTFGPDGVPSTPSRAGRAARLANLRNMDFMNELVDVAKEVTEVAGLAEPLPPIPIIAPPPAKLQISLPGSKKDKENAENTGADDGTNKSEAKREKQQQHQPPQPGFAAFLKPCAKDTQGESMRGEAKSYNAHSGLHNESSAPNHHHNDRHLSLDMRAGGPSSSSNYENRHYHDDYDGGHRPGQQFDDHRQNGDGRGYNNQSNRSGRDYHDNHGRDDHRSPPQAGHCPTDMYGRWGGPNLHPISRGDRRAMFQKSQSFVDRGSKKGFSVEPEPRSSLGGPMNRGGRGTLDRRSMMQRSQSVRMSAKNLMADGPDLLKSPTRSLSSRNLMVGLEDDNEPDLLKSPKRRPARGIYPVAGGDEPVLLKSPSRSSARSSSRNLMAGLENDEPDLLKSLSRPSEHLSSRNVMAGLEDDEPDLLKSPSRSSARMSSRNIMEGLDDDEPGGPKSPTLSPLETAMLKSPKRTSMKSAMLKSPKRHSSSDAAQLKSPMRSSIGASGPVPGRGIVPGRGMMDRRVLMQRSQSVRMTPKNKSSTENCGKSSVVAMVDRRSMMKKSQSVMFTPRKSSRGRKAGSDSSSDSESDGPSALRALIVSEADFKKKVFASPQNKSAIRRTKSNVDAVDCSLRGGKKIPTRAFAFKDQAPADFNWANHQASLQKSDIDEKHQKQKQTWSSLSDRRKPSPSPSSDRSSTSPPPSKNECFASPHKDKTTIEARSELEKKTVDDRTLVNKDEIESDSDNDNECNDAKDDISANEKEVNAPKEKKDSSAALEQPKNMNEIIALAWFQEGDKTNQKKKTNKKSTKGGNKEAGLAWFGLTRKDVSSDVESLSSESSVGSGLDESFSSLEHSKTIGDESMSIMDLQNESLLNLSDSKNDSSTRKSDSKNSLESAKGESQQPRENDDAKDDRVCCNPGRQRQTDRNRNPRGNSNEAMQKQANNCKPSSRGPIRPNPSAVSTSDKMSANRRAQGNQAPGPANKKLQDSPDSQTPDKMNVRRVKSSGPEIEVSKQLNDNSNRSPRAVNVANRKPQGNGNPAPCPVNRKSHGNPVNPNHDRKTIRRVKSSGPAMDVRITNQILQPQQRGGNFHAARDLYHSPRDNRPHDDQMGGSHRGGRTIARNAECGERMRSVSRTKHSGPPNEAEPSYRGGRSGSYDDMDSSVNSMRSQPRSRGGRPQGATMEGSMRGMRTRRGEDEMEGSMRDNRSRADIRRGDNVEESMRDSRSPVRNDMEGSMRGNRTRGGERSTYDNARDNRNGRGDNRQPTNMNWGKRSVRGDTIPKSHHDLGNPRLRGDPRDTSHATGRGDNRPRDRQRGVNEEDFHNSFRTNNNVRGAPMGMYQRNQQGRGSRGGANKDGGHNGDEFAQDAFSQDPFEHDPFSSDPFGQDAQSACASDPFAPSAFEPDAFSNSFRGDDFSNQNQRGRGHDVGGFHDRGRSASVQRRARGGYNPDRSRSSSRARNPNRTKASLTSFLNNDAKGRHVAPEDDCAMSVPWMDPNKRTNAKVQAWEKRLARQGANGSASVC